MKRIISVLLAVTVMVLSFSISANSVTLSEIVFHSLSEKTDAVPLESAFILHFKKNFRTFLNEFLIKAGLEIQVSATDIKIDKDAIAIEIGKTASLKATVDPKNARNKKVSWYSDNPVVAGVNENGTVSGRTEGKTTIYAVADDGGFYAKCSVTVRSATNSANFTVYYIDSARNLISKKIYSTATSSFINVNNETTISSDVGEFFGWICENNGVVYQNGDRIPVSDFYEYDSDGKMQSFTVTLRESVRYGITGADPAVTLFGGNGNDIYRAIEPSGDGGYFACGTTTSTTGVFAGRYESEWLLPFSFVSKLDSNGKTEWIKTFGSSLSGIYINDIAVLSDGNIIAVGYQSISDSSALLDEKGTSEALIYKLSGTDGSVIYEMTVGGEKSDVFNCVTATTKGFAVGGKTGSTKGDFEGYSENSAFIFHYDVNLNLLWKKAFSGSKGASVDGISADNSGNIFISCTTSSIDRDFSSFNGLKGGYIDTVIMKYNHLGTRLWYHVIASSGRDEFRSVQADGSGGCVVGGQYELYTTTIPDGSLEGIHNCGGTDALLFYIGTYGTLNKTVVISGYGDDYITDIAKGSKGYAVSGYSTSSNREFDSVGNAGNYDGFVCYVSSSGTILSMNSQAGTGEDSASCVACIGANYVVAGKTKSKNGCFIQYSGNAYMGYTAKYSLN